MDLDKRKGEAGRERDNGGNIRYLRMDRKSGDVSVRKKSENVQRGFAQARKDGRESWVEREKPERRDKDTRKRWRGQTCGE
ncbi:hypothetical protein NDU88_002445 [Pleurodeles waltl]|uniref:Uncharacterized protein n=1 Tax=Pleurodeles waltl TaxID=8319 RepID=A0AAV7P6S6_PLEWA|nr:hypothetical protein NDU88_002445 [Pleurodeles waltl]